MSMLAYNDESKILSITIPISFKRRHSRNMPKATQQQINQLLADIAKKYLNIEALETRNSDSLDFHDVAVWALKDALREAYEAGQSSQGILDY